jgi:hypothetical protein
MNIGLFIILGLAMSISLGTFIALIVTSGMDDGILKAITAIVISLVIGFGSVFLMGKYREHQEEKWNNGICTTCGAEWYFQCASKRKSTTTYYYTCENGHIFETDCFFQK